MLAEVHLRRKASELMDPKLQVLVDALPADGTTMEYTAWRDSLPRGYERFVHQARRAGVVDFGFEGEGDDRRHVVKRSAGGV